PSNFWNDDSDEVPPVHWQISLGPLVASFQPRDFQLPIVSLYENGSVTTQFILSLFQSDNPTVLRLFSLIAFGYPTT
ncbi:MAG: hypothetical protein V8Q80_10505, partial [Barnesiella intestinihominis]